MWWPSFCAVMVDLWQFAWGRKVAVAPGGVPPVIVAPTQPAIPVEALTPAADVVEPPEDTEPASLTLHPNIRYDAKHDTTLGVRQLLREQLVVLTGTDDLTAAEWLLYTYATAGKTLPWSALTVTPVGQWHETLRGKRGVSIGITPRTASLMEWRDAQGGYIATVVGVTPDQTVTAELVGVPLPGVLTTVTYTMEQWRELRPVFITIG